MAPLSGRGPGGDGNGDGITGTELGTLNNLFIMLLLLVCGSHRRVCHVPACALASAGEVDLLTKLSTLSKDMHNDCAQTNKGKGNNNA